MRLGFHIIILSAAFSLSSAAAQNELTEQEMRLQEIEEQLKANSADAAEIQQTVPQRERELENLRARLIETADSLKESETETTEIEFTLSGLEEEAIEVQASLNRQQQDISNVLAALQSLEWSKPPALAVSPNDAAEAARAAMALSATVPDLQSQVDALQLMIDRNTSIQEDLRNQREALLQSKADLDSRSSVLEGLLNQKEDEYQQVSARLRSIERENTLLADEATTIRELLKGLENRKLEEAAPIPRVRPDNEPNVAPESLARRPSLDVYNDLPGKFSLARGKLSFPVSGTIAQKYGAKTEAGETLEGMRIETRAGAIVTTPFSGEVAFAESLGRLGNVFILDVGENYHIIMMGLASLEVSAGETIKAGEPIGYMPDLQSREQLHFEIRRNREPLNPTSWFMPVTSG